MNIDTFNVKRMQAETCFRLIVFGLFTLLSACSGGPEIKPITQKQNSLIDYALSLQGVPYRWGKETPEEGFDCSGFVQHVYSRYGVKLPRTARDMASSLPPIDREELRAGDLVFFHTIPNNYYSHVGLFLNTDKFIHASSSRGGRVMISSMSTNYWRKRLVGIRRPIVSN